MRFYFSSVLFFTLQMTLVVAVQAKDVPIDARLVCPIKVGEILPHLSLHDIQGRPFDLNKALAQQPTVLIFYRGGWCPYCNRHLGEIKTISRELQNLGYQILAVSPDSPQNLKQSVDKNVLDYQLISDSRALAAQALGLAFRVDDDTYRKYLGYGIDLEQASGEKHHLLPVPAALVVDTSGTVRFAFTSHNYQIRVDTDVLLAAARSAIK